MLFLEESDTLTGILAAIFGVLIAILILVLILVIFCLIKKKDKCSFIGKLYYTFKKRKVCQDKYDLHDNGISSFTTCEDEDDSVKVHEMEKLDSLPFPVEPSVKENTRESLAISTSLVG